MVGSTISHYKILSRLGEGGMGVVYKAEDLKLERSVALKFLAAHVIEDPEHKARFVREAKVAARRDHQNICPVYEIDEVDGRTFMAPAYLEGPDRSKRRSPKVLSRSTKLSTSLRRFLRANGSAPPPHTPTHRRQEDRTLSLGVG